MDPEQLKLPGGWVIAVGVHPKHAREFGDCYFDQLSRLVDSPAVTALGEVGVDCSEGVEPFTLQFNTLKCALALCRPYLPLVLHIRASGNCPRETNAFYRTVLENVPNAQQAIPLHCFSGDSVSVKLWLDHYLRTPLYAIFQFYAVVIYKLLPL
ncbi:MAG: TatD family hydrolase, partial [Gammaproteobacteria bacterium]|nr:TatD family hydrolase [Gammaproteobacteria bacterium]